MYDRRMFTAIRALSAATSGRDSAPMRQSRELLRKQKLGLPNPKRHYRMTFLLLVRDPQRLFPNLCSPKKLDVTPVSVSLTRKRTLRLPFCSGSLTTRFHDRRVRLPQG